MKLLSNKKDQFTKKGWMFILSLFLFYSCSPEEESGSLSAYERNVVSYFKDVALGFEFGGTTEVTRKWAVPMRIFVGGDPSTELMNELNDIVDEINELTTDSFVMSITADTAQSNCYIFFGSGGDFAEVYPPATNHVAGNWGLFYVNFDGGNNLYRAVIYIDIIRADGDEQKHLLREELTQSLGFGKDSHKYPESIFQSEWTTTTEYADIDRDVIRLLYNPRMFVGLNRTQVDPVLRSLVTNF
jgi:hypothetical protein